MIKSINVKKDTVLEERVIVDKFEFAPLTILYACNGSGKSSLLDAIVNHSDEIEIDGEYKRIEFYKNGKDNHENIEPNPFDKLNFTSDMKDRIFTNYRSEGENIMHSLLSFLADLEDSEADVILLDEVDSGLSVEHINVIFFHISELIKNGKQVIFTCNTFHPIYITKKFTNMSTGKIEDCNSYEDFLKVAVETRKLLLDTKGVPVGIPI